MCVISRLLQAASTIVVIAMLAGRPVYAASGSPDSAFGTGGLVTLPATAFGQLNSVGMSDGVAALQSDGKIVAAYSSPSNFVLFRLMPNGSFDTTFGNGGYVAVSSINNAVMYPQHVALQPDGKIVVAGTSTVTVSFLMRFLPSGAVDTSFGTNGVAPIYITTAPSDQAEYVNGLLVLPDGRIMLGQPDGVRCYLSTGVLDTTYGVNGYASLPSGVLPRAIAMQASGQLVIGGTAVYWPFYAQDAGNQFLLTRLNADGTVDTSFGTNGLVALTIVPGQASALVDLLVQPDDNIVAVGSSNNNPTRGSGPVVANDVVLRLTPSGAVDSTFGSGGSLLVAEGSNGDATGYLTGVAFQPDGRLVVTGIRGINTLLGNITRLNSDGTFDSTFGVNGTTSISFADDQYTTFDEQRPYPVMVSPNGVIIAMGLYHDANTSFTAYFAQYLANDPNNTGSTAAWHLQPTAFAFPSELSVPLGATQKSTLATIAGLDAGVLVPAFVSNGESAVNGSSYTGAIKWVGNGAQIGVEQTAASTVSTETQTTLTVGGLYPTQSPGYNLAAAFSATFNTTTIATLIVPNVVGSTQAAATASITGAGLTANVSQQTSSSVNIGTVISQSPKPGANVSPGSAVSVVVSSGVVVPKVTGVTQSTASSTLTSAGLVVGTVSQVASTSADIGTVLSQTPATGTAVNPQTAVNLTVSSGTTVPSVVSVTQSSASNAITAAGLVVGAVTQQASTTVATGTVIAQSPTAGTAENPGTSVNLTVSSGPPPAGGGGSFDEYSILVLLVIAMIRSRTQYCRAKEWPFVPRQSSATRR